MLSTLAAVAAALLLVGADMSPEPAMNPVADFLGAADRDDIAGMEALIERRSTGFLGQIKGCYLRRVYIDKVNHEILATWMCAWARIALGWWWRGSARRKAARSVWSWGRT